MNPAYDHRGRVGSGRFPLLFLGLRTPQSDSVTCSTEQLGHFLVGTDAPRGLCGLFPHLEGQPEKAWRVTQFLGRLVRLLIVPKVDSMRSVVRRCAQR